MQIKKIFIIQKINLDDATLAKAAIVKPLLLGYKLKEITTKLKVSSLMEMTTF